MTVIDVIEREGSVYYSWDTYVNIYDTNLKLVCDKPMYMQVYTPQLCTEVNIAQTYVKFI
jgi:hypothetical protein